MREIKFRGMDIVNNKWLYGNLEIPLINQSKSKHFIVGHSYGQYQKHEVDPKTIGQYTGLKDKNGKEIYEGDIVRHATDEGVYKVIFEDGGFYVKNLFEYDFQAINEYPLEIIGNIYENLELLGGLK